MGKDNGTSYKILQIPNICLKTSWQTTNTHTWRKYKLEPLMRPGVFKRRKVC